MIEIVAEEVLQIFLVVFAWNLDANDGLIMKKVRSWTKEEYLIGSASWCLMGNSRKL